MSKLLPVIIQQLIDYFGEHEVMAELVDNPTMQHYLCTGKPEWPFNHVWRTESSTWRQPHVVTVVPYPTIFGSSDLQRPTN